MQAELVPRSPGSDSGAAVDYNIALTDAIGAALYSWWRQRDSSDVLDCEGQESQERPVLEMHC